MGLRTFLIAGFAALALPMNAGAVSVFADSISGQTFDNFFASGDNGDAVFNDDVGTLLDASFSFSTGDGNTEVILLTSFFSPSDSAAFTTFDFELFDVTGVETSIGSGSFTSGVAETLAFANPLLVGAGTTAADYRLDISIAGGGTSELAGVTVQAVPLPAGGVLLLTGLAGMGIVLRRRAKVAA